MMRHPEIRMSAFENPIAADRLGSSNRLAQKVSDFGPRTSDFLIMFTHFFIRRPIFAGVISLVIMLIGGFALLSLPIDRYPDIAPPTVTVSASYPGADARTVADTVATPIEQEVNGVEHMIYMESVSANDGSMTLTVTFETGTDLDMANVLVQNRVAAATSKLPEEVRRMGVKTEKQMSSANLFVAFNSPDGSRDDFFLSNFLNRDIKDEIARVNGVGKVQTFGVGEFSIRIWLDPDKMRSVGMTADEVVAAVTEQNRQVAAGQIGEPPVPKGQAYQFVINVKGRLATAEEFGDIVIRTGEDGRVIRVRDVARVELGSDTYLFSARINEKPCAAMAVYQIPGANALAVADGVMAKLEELKRNFPDGVDYADCLRQHRRHPIVHRRDDRDAVHHPGPRHLHGLRLPAELPGHADSGVDDPGLACRHLRCVVRSRFLHQPVHAVRIDPGDRHRGG